MCTKFQDYSIYISGVPSSLNDPDLGYLNADIVALFVVTMLEKLVFIAFTSIITSLDVP